MLCNVGATLCAMLRARDGVWAGKFRCRGSHDGEGLNHDKAARTSDRDGFVDRCNAGGGPDDLQRAAGSSARNLEHAGASTLECIANAAIAS